MAYTEEEQAKASAVTLTYYAAVEADAQWTKALTAAYGYAAGEARYDKRGKATPALKTLYEAKTRADGAFNEACKASRGES